MGYSKTLSMGDSFETGGTVTWSLSITTVATNFDLGTITLPSISSNLKYVFIDLIFQSIINTSALLNYIEANTNLVVDYHGTQTNALAIPSGSFWCYAGDTNRHLPGSRIYGNTDVKSEFGLGSATHLGIVTLAAHHDILIPTEIQPIARVVLE